MPTPEGVPVAMMVPGISVMPEESSSIISVIDVISRSVTEFCRSSPLIRELICKAGGNAISSADVIHGPIGVNPSNPFPKYHCL